MKVLLKQKFIVFSLCVLSACATSEEGSLGDPEPISSSGSDCISAQAVRDFSVLDQSNLIVQERGTRQYHVTLQRRVPGLRSNWRLGFASTAGRICAPFDEIIADSGGLGPERVRIASIRRINADQADELKVRFGLKEPEYETPREELDVEPAEVEELD
ncbi:MAG: DUF6491 family protein [Pseudomonadota bacterium]